MPAPKNAKNTNTWIIVKPVLKPAKNVLKPVMQWPHNNMNHLNFRTMKTSKHIIIVGLSIIALICSSFISYVDDSYYSKTNPALSASTFDQMKTSIDACNNCAAMCNNCSSMSLKEKDVTAMSRCIQLNMECASICKAASQLMSMESESSKEICKICADICKKCGDECSKHNTDHCKKCAEACYKAADLCKKM